MKKCLLFIGIIFGLGYFHFGYANIDFLVKPTTAPDESYASTLMDVATDTSLTFEAQSTGGPTTQTYLINFPSGFTYNSPYSIDGTCANFQVISASNTNFQYTFSGSNNCIMVVNMKYTVTTAGNKQINLLESGKVKNNLTVEVTANNTITQAMSRDTNQNGYIDAYEIHFSKTISNMNVIGLFVGGKTVHSFKGNTSSGLILFEDGIFSSGDTPQITSTGIIFGNIALLGNASISEQDGAKPILLKINNQSTSYSGIQISSNNIIFDFSEKLHPESISAFQLKKDDEKVNGTFTIQGEKLTFTPSFPLQSGNYLFLSTNQARDWSNNGNELSASIVPFIIPDTSAPWGLSLGNGIGIIINNGSSSTNNRYIQLTFLANDNIGIEKMCISNVALVSDITCVGGWQNYATSKLNWLLTSGNGNKIVYVKFQDATGNVSPVYNDSINYEEQLSYITFDTVDSIYTNSTVISLKGSCNYVDNFGNQITGNINFSVGKITGNFSCNTSQKSWTYNFSLTQNSINEIKIWYGNTYETSTIKNSLNLIHPIPNCPTSPYGTAIGVYPNCDLTCQTGYNKVGNSCIAQKREGECTGLPNQAVWNSTHTILQTWNGNIWLPTLTGSYQIASSTNECKFVCVSGYTWNGAECVITQNNSGGGGGGGTSSNILTCTNNDLVCTPYLGKYVWTRKIGNTCQNGGNLGKTCFLGSIPEGLFGNDFENYIKENTGGVTIEVVKKYLLENTDLSLAPLIEAVNKKITIDTIDYFISFDMELLNNYTYLLVEYKNLFTYLNTYKKTSDKKDLGKAKESLKKFVQSYEKVKNPENRYITKQKIGDVMVYQTNVKTLEIKMKKVEGILLKKYNKLLMSKTISQNTYQQIIHDYNNFILYVSIYKMYHNEEAKNLAKEYGLKVVKYYQMKEKR